MTDLDTRVADVRAHAAALHNEWDRRAIDWPLTPDSVVVEVGGYTGRWALQIADRYAPRLFVFEPQGWAFEVCRAVLGDRATVEPYGLGVETGYFPMGGYGGDGASFLKDDGEQTGGEMMDVAAAFAQLHITHIDLLLMNIEGYEYMLIPYMLECGILPDRLMVQFHQHPGEEARTMAIYDQLDGLGYHVKWTYGITLTAWERGAGPK